MKKLLIIFFMFLGNLSIMARTVKSFNEDWTFKEDHSLQIL